MESREEEEGAWLSASQVLTDERGRASAAAPSFHWRREEPLPEEGGHWRELTSVSGARGGRHARCGRPGGGAGEDGGARGRPRGSSSGPSEGPSPGEGLRGEIGCNGKNVRVIGRSLRYVK